VEAKGYLEREGFRCIHVLNDVDIWFHANYTRAYIQTLKSPTK
jgi:hypothetical protein